MTQRVELLLFLSTLIKHNSTTTCTTLCLFPFCCQNSPDLLRSSTHHWSAVVSIYEQQIVLVIVFLKPFLNNSLCQGAFSCWKRPQPSGNIISMKRCTWYATVIMLLVHVAQISIFLLYILLPCVPQVSAFSSGSRHGYWSAGVKTYSKYKNALNMQLWLPMTMLLVPP